MKHAFAMAAAMMLLAGCSSADERLCRASIDETLINPETAEYSGYRVLGVDEIQADQFLSFRPKVMERVIAQEGATYSTMKVRAEGRLGNVITSQEFCAINAAKDQCFCLGTD